MSENKLADTARKLLDESAAGLDGPTSARLHQARNRALARLDRTDSGWLGWFGTGSLAASLALVALLMGRSPGVDGPTPVLPDVYDDPVQQAVVREMELMDDLDFIAWLVMEEGEADASDQSS